VEAVTLVNDYCASIKVFVTSTIEGLFSTDIDMFLFCYTRTGCDQSPYTCSIIPGFFDVVQCERSGPHRRHAENHSKLRYTGKRLRQWSRTLPHTHVIKV